MQTLTVLFFCFTKAVIDHKVCGCWRAFDGRTAASIRPLAAARRVKFLRFIPSFLVPSRKVSPHSLRSGFFEPFRARETKSYDRAREVKSIESFCLLPAALPSPGASAAVLELLDEVASLPRLPLQRLLVATVGATDLAVSSLPGRRPPHLRLSANRFPVSVYYYPTADAAFY